MLKLTPLQMFGEQDEDDPFITKNKDTAAAIEITKLYGDWQTDEWIPPKAEHGIVPKNERGNVLCPPLAYALPLVCINIHSLSVDCLMLILCLPATKGFWQLNEMARKSALLLYLHHLYQRCHPTLRRPAQCLPWLHPAVLLCGSCMPAWSD